MPKRKKRVVSWEDLMDEITEALHEWDGDDLAELANQVLHGTVSYNGDTFFTVEEES